MSEVLREVQDGETIEVINHGKVVALLVPPRTRLSGEKIEAALGSMDALAAQIGVHRLENVTALKAVQDVRRRL